MRYEYLYVKSERFEEEEPTIESGRVLLNVKNNDAFISS